MFQTAGLFHFSRFYGGKALFDGVKDIILSIIKVTEHSERGLRREAFAFLTSFNAASHNLSCSDPSLFCALCE